MWGQDWITTGVKIPLQNTMLILFEDVRNKITIEEWFFPLPENNQHRAQGSHLDKKGRRKIRSVTRERLYKWRDERKSRVEKAAGRIGWPPL